MRIREIIKPYVQAMPDIFSYQMITKAVLAVWLFLLGRIFQALLRSSGRVAVTTGDWKFLFTTWQGILILLLGAVFISGTDRGDLFSGHRHRQSLHTARRSHR